MSLRGFYELLAVGRRIAGRALLLTDQARAYALLCGFLSLLTTLISLRIASVLLSPIRLGNIKLFANE